MNRLMYTSAVLTLAVLIVQCVPMDGPAMAAFAASAGSRGPVGEHMSPHWSMEDTMGDSLTWGTAQHGLRLGVAVHDGILTVALKNVGRHSVTVCRFIRANETQYDWYTATLTPTSGPARTLQFEDARDESGPVVATLRPGEDVRNEINLKEWALRGPNGKQAIAPGTYRLSLKYVVDGRSGVWNGSLSAGPITMVVTAR